MVYPSCGIKSKSTNPPPVNETLRDVVFKSDGTVYSESYAAVPMELYESGIVYTNLPLALRYRSNLCRHYIYHYKTGKTTASGSYVPFAGYTYQYQQQSGVGYNSRVEVVNALKTSLGTVKTGFDVLNGDGQGYINDAFVKLKPDLTGVSIPNFLLELDELPRLFQLWKKNLGALRTAANGLLNIRYGWRPLQGDLQAMLDIIYTVREKCRQWNAFAGIIDRKSCTLKTTGGSGNGSFVHTGTGYTLVWSGNFKGTVTAHMQFKTLRIAALDEAYTMLKVYLDAFGFERNPQILWDAIPFTFVLDWFFDVGGWLRRFKKDTLELPIVLVDSCLQYKEELSATWKGSYEAPKPGATNYSPRISTGNFNVRAKTFHRLPIFPDLSAATAQGWKIPGINQLTNAIALGVSVWHK